MDQDTRIDLQAAMATLTDKQRDALELWVQGYTQEQIGEMLGIRQQPAGRRVERAIERMREFLC